MPILQRARLGSRGATTKGSQRDGRLELKRCNFTSSLRLITLIEAQNNYPVHSYQYNCPLISLPRPWDVRRRDPKTAPVQILETTPSRTQIEPRLIGDR